jgi:ribose transport system substrate-binding protein
MKKLLSTLLALSVASVFAADSYKIAVIPKGTSHEYWKAVNAGAVKAQREIEAGGAKIELFWKGPVREDDREQQVQVIENFIGRRVNAIVLSPLDNKALVAPVETAVRGKIPVVIIDSSLNSKAPASYVATDNSQGGRLAARELARLIGGKGKVVMLRYSPGSASTEQREEGFLEVMKKEFPDIVLLSVDQHAGVTRDGAYRAAQNILNRHGKEVNGIFAVNLPSTVGMLLAVRDIGLNGKVKFVGFDASTQLVDAVKAGDVSALIVQDPFNMGYLGVKTAVSVLRGEKVEAVIDTGVNVVTKENLNDPKIADLLNPPLDKYLK